MASVDEEPAQFDTTHYAKGLNANFLLGTTEEIIATHAGEKGEGGGRFEDPESRDIARGRDALLAVVARHTTFSGAVVADIGAGTGLFMSPLVEAVGESGKVYEVELSPQFCEHLTATAKRKGLSTHVAVVKCSDKSCELPPASIDIGFICDVYHHFEYPKSFMRSLAAALRPGGTVFVIDFHRDSTKVTSHPPEWVYAHLRADQATFTAEIEDSGFVLDAELDVPELKENYVMAFKKRA